MKLIAAVTFFVGSVILLSNFAFASEGTQTSTSTTNSANTPTVTLQPGIVTTKKASSSTPTASPFSALFSISRSVSLIDFEDGTRSDSIEFLFAPSWAFSFGKISTKLTYAKDNRDEESTSNGFADTPLTFSFKGTPVYLLSAYDSKISYSTTAVIPASKISTKKDQLQTAISGSIGFGLTPKNGEGFSILTSISLGRNFHAYEEDINGNVLNQYSSNQALSLAYAVGDWSLGVDYLHRTRWTYRGNIKTAFALGQEIGYGINKNISVAMGHTNEGSTLRPNGTDSNIDIFNENSSTIYGTLNITY
jgi:hypothetical protein